MTDKQRVAEVAAGLSEAQRDALKAFDECWRAGPNMSDRIIDEIKGLEAIELLERQFGDDGPPVVSEGDRCVSVKIAACWFFRLSQTGLAVRAHLEKQ